MKQRLSRGRKLLHDQVLAFVEGALERTNPGKAFTWGVLAALPALSTSAKAATLGATAVKGSAVAKVAAATGLFTLLLGQGLIFAGNYFGYRAGLAAAHSDVERGYIKTFYRRNIAFTLGFFIPLAALLWWNCRHQQGHMYWFRLVPVFLVIYILVTTVAAIATHGKRRKYFASLLAQHSAHDLPKPAWEYRSRWSLFGLPLVHMRMGDRYAMLRGR